MTRIRPFALVVFTLLLALHAFVLPGFATDAAGFVVRPDLPDNQVAGVKGYFDLIVEPGTEQDLTLAITNREEESITVSVSTVTASTNANGVINYSTSGQMDETLAHSFAELSKIVDEQLLVPAGTTVYTTVRVRVPDEAFEGSILGSIQVVRELTEEELEAAGMIVNQYSYVVAVRLRRSEESAGADFALGEVHADLTNGRASVIAEIRNIRPSLIKGASATMQIESKSSGTAVFQQSMPNVDVAPNSIFPMTVTDQQGYGVQPGDYIARIQMQHKDRLWEFEQEFTINPTQAGEINTGAVNVQAAPQASGGGLPTWAIACGLVLLALIVLLLFLLLRGRRAAFR